MRREGLRRISPNYRPRHGNPFSAEAGGRGAKNDVRPNATAAGRKISYLAFGKRGACCWVLFFNAAIRIELREIGPKVIHLLFVLDPGKDHLGARNHALRVLNVSFESSLVPNNSRILVRL